MSLKHEVGKTADKLKEEVRPYRNRVSSWLGKNGKLLGIAVVIVFMAIIAGVILSYVKL